MNRGGDPEATPSLKEHVDAAAEKSQFLQKCGLESSPAPVGGVSPWTHRQQLRALRFYFYFFSSTHKVGRESDERIWEELKIKN